MDYFYQSMRRLCFDPCLSIYLLVCMYLCMLSTFLKTTGPNYMKFSGKICHYPRTNWLDFGSDQVKGQGQSHDGLKNYWTDCMKFSGMICHHPRTNRLDLGSNQVKGQGQGHEKVKNLFLS